MPVTNIRSKWSSGDLYFFESASVAPSTTYNVFKIADDAVQIGDTGNDIDFGVYGTGSVSFVIDIGSTSITSAGFDWDITGDVVLTGDIDVATAAMDLVIKANTAAALEISDATTKVMAFDTRNTVTGVTAVAITAPASTIASASGVTDVAVGITSGTTTFTGTTGVTAMEGMGVNIAAPVFAGTAVAVATASTVYIAGAPTAGGSVTVTNGEALHVDAGISKFGGLVRLDAAGGYPAASALLMGVGTSANPATTATASKNMMEFRTQTTATSGASRGLYWRHEFAGAGTGTGEGLRFNTILNADIASCSGGSSTLTLKSGASVTGECAGFSQGLTVPDEAIAANGGYYGGTTEIYCGGSSSSLAAATRYAVHRFRTAGDGTGQDAVKNMLAFEANTDGSGNSIYTNGHDAGNAAGSIRVLINGSAKYMKFWDSE